MLGNKDDDDRTKWEHLLPDNVQAEQVLALRKAKWRCTPPTDENAGPDNKFASMFGGLNGR